MEEQGQLTLRGREALTVTGVQEVLAFGDTQVVLSTQLGLLTVQGSQLRLRGLDEALGRLELRGEISALGYEEPRSPGSWLHRLLG